MAFDNPLVLWSIVRTLLHPHSGGDWYDRLDISTLAVDIQTFFADKVNQVKTKVTAGLRSVTNWQFIFSDPVTQARFSTSLIYLMLWWSIQLDQYRPIHHHWICCQHQSSKHATPNFQKIISHIANRLFAVGRFSLVWKTGLVSQFLKKPGLPTFNFKNFQLTTNLTTVLKIVERLVLALPRFTLLLCLISVLCSQCTVQLSHHWDSSFQDHWWHSSIHRLGLHRYISRPRYLHGLRHGESRDTTGEASVRLRCHWHLTQLDCITSFR